MSGRANNDNRRELCRGSMGTSFRARRWLSLDPCGCSGVLLSWSVHFYALVIIPLKITSNSVIATLLYFAVYIPASLLAMTSLFQAWTTNPGAVPMGARPLTIVRRASSSLSAHSSGSGENGNLQVQNQRGVRRCHKCNDNYKPPRAHHDSVTGRCIVKFDHFCPWVGNAVGALNHKFFCLFLFYTAICCSISLLLLFIRAVHCGYLIDPDSTKQEENIQHSMHSYEKKSSHNSGIFSNTVTSGNASEGGEEDGGSRIRILQRAATIYKYPECNDFYSSHWVWALAVASLVFLIFTCSMGCEQLDAIETGKGKIARMKMSVGSTGTEYSRVTEEFNEMFGGDTGPRVAWHWFFPWRNVTFPRSMKKVVLGYEWDESLQQHQCDEPFYYPDDTNTNNTSIAIDRASPTGIDALGDREMSELEGGRLKAPPPTTTSATGQQMPLPPITSNGSLLSHNGLDTYNLESVPITKPSTSRSSSKDALLLRPDPSETLHDDRTRSNVVAIDENNSKNTPPPTVVLAAAAASTGGIVVAGSGGGSSSSTHSGTFGIKNRIAAQKMAAASGGGGVGNGSGSGTTLVERTMTRIT